MLGIVSAVGVILVMTKVSGRLSVPTGRIVNQTTERDIFKVGSVDGETCHQVAELVGASELFQWDGNPELSNADGKTPSDSFVAVFGE